VIVGPGNDSLWGVDGVFLVSSERKSLGLVIVFWFLSVVIERSRPEDEIGTQGKGIYPMSVFVQRSDQFPLSERNPMWVSRKCKRMMNQNFAYILRAPDLDGSIATSGVDQAFSAPSHDVDTGIVSSQGKLGKRLSRGPDLDRPILGRGGTPGLRRVAKFPKKVS
jgi:hypothetical protein